MDLSTKYLGLKLKSPVIVGSSTFTGSVEGVKNCAAAGAGAVVLKSLFEEQILADIKKKKVIPIFMMPCRMLIDI